MTLHFTGRAELMASWDKWIDELWYARLSDDHASMKEANQMCERFWAALRDTPMGGDGEGNAHGG
jgi:hypothetical protein